MLIRFTIYCSRCEGHPVVKTLLFAPDEEGRFEWTVPVAGLRVGDRRALETGDFLGDASGEHARWRREFRCATCSASEVVAREENFRPIVEELLRHGVARLSLAGLKGRLAPGS